MDDIDLDRYFRNHKLRADLEARARQERAETVAKILVVAARWLSRLPARLRKELAAPGNGAQSAS